MNETLNTIANRRSIRSFEPTTISDNDLKLILEAGTCAPSAMNMQSGKIFLVTDPTIQNELRKIGTSISPRKSDPFYGAPYIIIVLAKKNTPCPIQDGSLIMGNMVLASRSLGIGSCWINCLKDILNTEDGKKIKDIIDKDDEYLAVAALALGYPKDGIWPTTKEKKEDYINYCFCNPDTVS